jgi:hypothetical protein
VKKSYTPDGLSLPELKEVVRRLQDKEPELEAILRCFECGARAEYDHHVIPETLGGRKTLALCGACHAKIHGEHMLRTGPLTREALARKRKHGQKTGGDVPFGYDLKGGLLVENEKEQAIIRAIQDKRREGLSLRQVARGLEAKGVKTKRGLASWQAQTVSRIVKR